MSEPLSVEEELAAAEAAMVGNGSRRPPPLDESPPYAPDECEVPEEDDEDGPSVALDVALMKSEAEKAPPKLVIDGLLKLKDIIGLAGEEGDGKTTLADQFCRELIRGEPLFGMFEPGEFAPERVLFVDTHQEQEEWEDRTLDMSERGLDVEPGRYFWWHPDGGLILSTNEGDRTQLEAQIGWTGATFVWFDAASHLVEEAKDDSDVKKLFEYLSGLQSRHELVGIGMTLFNRKRAAGDYTRRFDDLFGSREWKGRLSRAVYIEANKITCWKDRGSLLRACWPHRVGSGRYPQARLDRPGFDDPTSVPFTIEVSEAPPDAVEVEDIEAKVIDVLTATPDAYTKTSLAGKVGGRAEDVRQVINQMLADSKIGPNRRGAKLHVEGDATPMTLIENEE